MCIHVDVGVGASHRPDKAVAFLVRQLDQSVVGLIHAYETCVARDSEQLPVVLVRPRVVRAGETGCAA